MESFFPLNKELIENPEFKKLPVISRLFYLLLISDFNECGEFHRSDQANAVKLKTSVDTIRRARRQFEKLEWIEVKKGFRSSTEKNVATTYLNVKYANTEKGQLFAKMQRYAFQKLLMLRTLYDFRNIDEKVILTYCYFTYLQTKFCGDFEEGFKPFYISKRDFADLTGFTDFNETLEKISKPFFSKDKSPLIKLNNQYHKIIVETIYTINEDQESWQKDVDELKRKIARTKNHESEKIVDLFAELYKKQYNRLPGLVDSQKAEMIELAKRYGNKKMQIAIRAFFNATNLPSKTANVFMKHYIAFM